MSAFIIDDSSINGIVNQMVSEEYADKMWNDLQKLGLHKDSPEALAQAMLDLNYESVNARYKEDDIAPAIDYKPKVFGKIQALKSLMCFLYQSCEGNCTEKTLYKILDAYSGAIAFDIINKLPEYKAASWN